MIILMGFSTLHAFKVKLIYEHPQLRTGGQYDLKDKPPYLSKHLLCPSIWKTVNIMSHHCYNHHHNFFEHAGVGNILQLSPNDYAQLHGFWVSTTWIHVAHLASTPTHVLYFLSNKIIRGLLTFLTLFNFQTNILKLHIHFFYILVFIFH